MSPAARLLTLACAGLILGCSQASAADPTDPAALDLTGMDFPGAEHIADGVAFRFDLGTERRNWNHARWSRVAFAEPRDLSGSVGLQLQVASPTPRADVGVYLALQEADGSWHYHAWACDLTKEQNTGTIRFADFRPATWVAPHVHGMPDDFLDENQVFDPEAVTGMAIGCINPLGVGEVAFTLTGLELLADKPAPIEPLTVTVTGELIDINGTTMLPAGLFGHFPGGGSRAMRMGSHREIHRSYLSGDGEGGVKAHKQFGEPGMAVLLDVQGGDRYSASGRLTRANWEESYRNSGRHRGRQWLAYQAQYRPTDGPATGPMYLFEWWNEPYLNWSNRSRKNFDPKFFDQSRAVEGGPVHLTVDGSVAPYLRWTKDYDAPPWNWKKREEWRAGKDAKGNINYRVSPPADVADGEEFTVDVTRKVRNKETGKKERKKVGEKTYTAVTPWYVYDETQFTYWSGKGQLRHYNEPLMAFAEGLHEVAPEAPLLAGWDFRCSEDHWAAWEMVYKPTVDLAIDHLVGVTDHDYGGDVTRMPANYEFVAAYGVTQHDKWLYSYNSECGENSDPSAMPAANASMRQAGKKWLKTMWSARKILHALATVPDKARSFTFHWFDQGAEGVTFTALRNLRGRLLHVDCPDPELYAVAAIDGTDPDLPRPDFLDSEADRELVVAIFNDHAEAREVSLPITAPAGTKLGAGVWRQPVPDPDGGVVRIEEHELAATGERVTWSGTIPSRSFVAISLPLDGEPPGTSQLLRRQFFAGEQLQGVTPAQAVELTVAIPADVRKGARRAHLRCVFERLAADEGRVSLNGTDIALPRCPTPENVCWIRDIPIDPALLQDDNTLVFTAAPETAGYHLVMASVVVDVAPAP